MFIVSEAPLALAVIFFLFCYVMYKYCLYPAFISPLAKIPNAHWTSSFAPCWILWKRFCGRELPSAYDAHQRLGPIVRVGPKDLSISCYSEGVRKVYGSGFDKPGYYDFFRYYESVTNQLILRSRSILKPRQNFKRFLQPHEAGSLSSSKENFHRVFQVGVV
jgi:hypothetical protein